MADVFSREKRSEVMSVIRSKDTKAELVVFKFLRSSKVYFKRHYDRAPGKPDIALPRKKIAVFIDGDFWHGRHDTKTQKLPKEYWQPKIARNIERDAAVNKALIDGGWKVLRVWESDILRKRTRDEQLQIIMEFLLQK